MSYAAKDGKDTVVFVDKEYIDNQQEETVTTSQKEDSSATAATNEEKDQSAAYDPETGEINWDCPCLGGMAQGPCGEQFKAAFSCFVYSEAEPKGFDCVEKFKNMQDCFREHPDIYGDEIDDDDEDESTATIDKQEAPAASTETHSATAEDEEKEQVTASSVCESGDDNQSSWFSSWFS